MDKRIKGYIFLIAGIFLFFFNLIFSPYSIKTLNEVRREIKRAFLFLKILKKDVIINKKGRDFNLISYGFNFCDAHPLFLFRFGKYYYTDYRRGIYLVCVIKDKLTHINLYDTYKSEEEVYKLIDFLNLLPDSCLLFFSVVDEASLKWNDEIDSKFKEMGAKETLKGKYRWSYIFITRKEGDKFTPIYEIISRDKAIFLKIKI